MVASRLVNGQEIRFIFHLLCKNNTEEIQENIIQSKKILNINLLIFLIMSKGINPHTTSINNIHDYFIVYSMKMSKMGKKSRPKFKLS